MRLFNLLLATGLVLVPLGLAMTGRPQAQSQPLVLTTDTIEKKSMINASSRPASSLWSKFQRHQYGKDPANTVYLYQPAAKGPVPLAVLVHGGNYLFGSATDYSLMPLADYFMRRGYAVASVDYRSLQRGTWPQPVNDVKDGIAYVHRLLGNRVSDTTYVGFSAGAVTGALLLYSKQFPSAAGIDRFVGISGLYDKAAVSQTPIDAIREQIMQRIDLLNVVDSIRQAKTATPALLIEGARDYFADNFPHTESSHASRLRQMLRNHGADARVFWTTGPYGSHEGPIAMLAAGDSKLIAALDQFLPR